MVVLLCILEAVLRRKHLTYDALYDEAQNDRRETKERVKQLFARVLLLASVFVTLLYIYWRVAYSIPVKSGVIASVCNLLLLAVEALGFVESLALYANLVRKKNHPLPKIADEEYPEVDVFIATYNEPAELLRRTINGCVHMKYPDRSKVHIWLCDDNRRSEMRALAEEMGVGYFDRPDNEGAKAGNLNHALGLTSAPYVVTPHTYREHIQQRSRWGRGVISTAKSLKLFRRKGLSLAQKFSYWSSVIY